MPSADPRLTSPAWRKLRLVILDRDKWMCQVDGCDNVATTVDHVISRVEGGDFWDPANLRAACRRCNIGRGWALGNSRRVARMSNHDTRM